MNNSGGFINIPGEDLGRLQVCIADFRKTATSVKNGEHRVPQNWGLADAVRRYLYKACQNSDMYPSYQVTPPKHKKPFLVKMGMTP